jgi:hypothetical protein
MFIVAANLFISCFLTTNASAATISTTGAITTLTSPPSDVTLNALESDTEMWVFDEVQGLVLQADLNVDFGGTDGVISAGTEINSHFVHKDTLGGTVTLSGTATFDGIILGIIASPGNLNTSDSILGLTGTSYPFGLDRRGTQIGEVGDSIAFAIDTLILTSATSSRPDQLRVITAVSTVPVPAAVWLFGSGLLGLVGIARRKKTT